MKISRFSLLIVALLVVLSLLNVARSAAGPSFLQKHGFGDNSESLSITRTDDGATATVVVAGTSLTLRAEAVGGGDDETVTQKIFEGETEIASGDDPLTTTVTPTAGKHTYTAKATFTRKSDGLTDPQTSTADVTVVGVHHVEITGPQGDAFVGDEISLRAYPDPEDVSFPANWPVWKLFATRGGAPLTAPAGASASYTPTKEGLYVFTAKCGTSEKDARVRVVKPARPPVPGQDPFPDTAPWSPGSRGSISLWADPGTVGSGETTQLWATIRKPKAGVTVSFTADAQPIGNAQTNGFGIATMTSPALTQTTLFCAAAASYGYDTRTVTVAPPGSWRVSLTATPSIVVRGEASVLAAVVKNGNGDLVAGTDVVFSYNGTTQTVRTDEEGELCGVALLTVNPTETTLFTATANGVSDSTRVIVEEPENVLRLTDDIWKGTALDADDDKSNPEEPLVAGPKTLGAGADQKAHITVELTDIMLGAEHPWAVYPRSITRPATQPSGDPIVSGTFSAASPTTQPVLSPGKYVLVTSNSSDGLFDRRVGIDVPQVDLIAYVSETEPLGEDNEENPGLMITTSGSKLVVKPTGITNNDGTVLYPRRVIWDDPNKLVVQKMVNGQPVAVSSPVDLSTTDDEVELRVRPADSMQDYTTIKLEVNGGNGGSQGPTFVDQVRLSRVEIKKIPLGGGTALSSRCLGKIYVPDKAGGKLKVSGGSIDLFYTDGSAPSVAVADQILLGALGDNKVATGSPVSYDVPEGKHGWYYVKAAGNVTAEFWQEGMAEKDGSPWVPWNFWYFPFQQQDTADRNLFKIAVPNQATAKYDAFLGAGTATEDWECMYHRSGSLDGIMIPDHNDAGYPQLTWTVNPNNLPSLAWRLEYQGNNRFAVFFGAAGGWQYDGALTLGTPYVSRDGKITITVPTTTTYIQGDAFQIGDVQSLDAYSFVPAIVGGYKVAGQILFGTFGEDAVKDEEWTLEYVGNQEWKVTGSEAGYQGDDYKARTGSLYTTDNGVQFTIDARFTYTVGKTLKFRVVDPGAGWWGHCWGGSVASILLAQPVAAQGLTEEELEGLCSCFMNAYGAPSIFVGWPFVKPLAADNAVDPTDVLAHVFHAALRDHVWKAKHPIHMDLRQEDGEGDKPAIWNQGVYKFKAVFTEAPGALGNENEKVRQVNIETIFAANDDKYPNTGTPETGIKREQIATYRLVYNAAGDISPAYGLTGPPEALLKQNWMTMK